MTGSVVRTYRQSASSWRCCGVGGNWIGPRIQETEVGLAMRCRSCGMLHVRLYAPRHFDGLRRWWRRLVRAGRGAHEGRRMKAEGNGGNGRG